MKKQYTALLSALFLIVLISGIFYVMMPLSYDKNQEVPFPEFSVKRALRHVQAISRKPHFVGSKNHEEVSNYLQRELQNLGLETTVQEGFTITEGGTLVKSKNILARKIGTDNSKALLLLSHYDSAPHSFSKGASDDAAGIATILEGFRAFLHQNKQHKNDIVILFSDAEELGLNGAALFVTQHHWAKEIGLALNFEARGTSGPGFMLMETNQGNAKMIAGFKAGNVDYPVANSLYYSIYKLLPNDTDLTVFREQGKVQGFNFAFIDNHFNYHTAQDNYENLNPRSLAHQGSYLLPLLNHFSNADLTHLNSDKDSVYFSIPFGLVTYPFDWIFPLLTGAFVLFLLVVLVGLGKRVFSVTEILKGFLPLLGSLTVSGIVAFFGWKLLLMVYPQYNDILQGFTYNGHDYIYAFISLTLAICFLFYQTKRKQNPEMVQMIAPLFIWLLINLGIAFKLQGGAFFIFPVMASTLMLGFFVLSQRSSAILNLILAIPTLIILVPFVQMLPIGLGLKLLAGTSALTVLCFTLLLPVFGAFSQKIIWAVLFFFISIGFFAKAHLNSEYTNEQTKPNSLVYVLNANVNKAYWTTYDTNLDEWTKNKLGENPKKASSLNVNKLYSKYGTEFTFMGEASMLPIAKPTIEFLRDTVKGNQRLFRIKITPNRKVNRYDVFVNGSVKVNNLMANGAKLIEMKSNMASKTPGKIITYYVVDSIPLEMNFSIGAKQKLNMELWESSFDLLSNPVLHVEKRKSWMMPKPFVLNDAVIVKQRIKR